MPNRSMVQLALGRIFPRSGVGRISRWLGVNPRTIQRWQEKGGGDILDEDMPLPLREKITAVAALITTHEVDIRLREQLQWFIDHGIPEEVLAAHVAAAYHDLTGREIE